MWSRSWHVLYFLIVLHSTTYNSSLQHRQGETSHAHKQKEAAKVLAKVLAKVASKRWSVSSFQGLFVLRFPDAASGTYLPWWDCLHAAAVFPHLQLNDSTEPLLKIYRGKFIEILGATLGEACLKKGRIFFSWSPPYFVKPREVSWPLKNCSFEVNFLVWG
jgi:hypothetical protein